MDTTRRYPRSLQEAFPGSPEYASAIEKPMHRHDLIVMRAGIAAIAFVIVWGLL